MSLSISLLTRDRRSVLGPPWWLSSKDSTCSTGDTGSIPGLGSSSGKGNDNPLQYSCLGNPTDRGAWWAIVHGVRQVRHNLASKPPHIHYQV